MCPRSIVYIADSNRWSTNRYGEAASYQQMRRHQERELANCNDALKEGEIRAMRVLESHWLDQQNPTERAAVYKTYVDHGSDSALLEQVSVSLYTLYIRGEPGLAPDPSQAVTYLGLAVGFGNDALRLNYAELLLALQRQDEAFEQYTRLALRTMQEQPNLFTTLQRCDINLQLGAMYLLGQGTQENAYLGDYFWQRGLQLTEGDEFGSCVKNNFTHGQRYTLESARYRMVSQRLAQLSSAERSRISRTLRQEYLAGYQTVAAIPYTSRPVSALGLQTHPGAARSSGAKVASGQRTSTGWPRWLPLSASVCQLNPAGPGRSWSEVFKFTGDSVWTLYSSSDGNKQQGSAVAISPRALITNCHMILDPQRVELRSSRGKMSAKVIAADLDGDRCLLQSSATLSGYINYSRDHQNLDIGEEVAAIGSPKGLSNTLSRGIVAGQRTRKGQALIQTDAALSSGSSGGGLFDQAGNLVGITTFGIEEGNQLNFAIAVSEFCKP
ncbi:MAG: S1C family serine protease [Halioglobus sp.]